MHLATLERRKKKSDIWTNFLCTGYPDLRKTCCITYGRKYGTKAWVSSSGGQAVTNAGPKSLPTMGWTPPPVPIQLHILVSLHRHMAAQMETPAHTWLRCGHTLLPMFEPAWVSIPKQRLVVRDQHLPRLSQGSALKTLTPLTKDLVASMSLPSGELLHLIQGRISIFPADTRASSLLPYDKLLLGFVRPCARREGCTHREQPVAPFNTPQRHHLKMKTVPKWNS